MNGNWVKKDWGALSDVSGLNIWAAGVDIYYSEGEQQYQLNAARTAWTWIRDSWNGLKSFDGEQIWTDGEEFYYSETPETTSESSEISAA